MWRAVPVFLLLVAFVLAQEKTPAGTPAAGEVDPIAGAKREFEGVKADRGATEQAKPGLTSRAMPELTLGKPSPKLQLRAKTPAELLAEKNSANWLVDAMLKKDNKSADAAGTSLDEATMRELKLDPAIAARVAVEKPRDDKAADRTLAARTGPEFNPLAQFMAGWMTPQDYSLLKPGLGGESADVLVARGEASIAGPTGELAMISEKSSGLAASASGREASPSSLAALAGNPYLQAFSPPPQNITSFAAPPSAAAPRSTGTVLTPAPEQSAVKQRMPEFVKPATDEKYFKQLKRF